MIPPSTIVVISMTLVCLQILTAAEARGPLPAGKFVNPIAEGADPWVTRDPNHPRYLWCYSVSNLGIAIRAGDKLSTPTPGKTIWRAPETGPYSREVWAPELHYLDDRWHIYFAADDGNNPNHRSYVLRSESKDPFGEYKLHGPLATGDGEDGMSPNIWAIDMTPLEVSGKRYAIWSGWDAPGTDRQFLYIAPMKSGVELAGPRVRICANNTHPWELTGTDANDRGLNEGPQILQHHGRTFVAFSCGASWKPNYKLGLLELTGADPLDPASWIKFPEPVFQSANGTIGTGHSSFVTSPDGTEWWHVYHAKISPEFGWERRIHIQPFTFDGQGMPQFGKPLSIGTPLDRPSGDRTSAATLPASFSLKKEAPQDTFAYYGLRKHLDFTADGLLLGRQTASRSTGDSPSGAKLLLDRTLPDDLKLEVTIDFQGLKESSEGGILFRITAASMGRDAYRGYFAGISPATRQVVLGKSNGTDWMNIKSVHYPVEPSTSQRLRIETHGDMIKVIVDDKTVIEATDHQFPHGTVGLQVADSRVLFSKLTIDGPKKK